MRPPRHKKLFPTLSKHEQAELREGLQRNALMRDTIGQLQDDIWDMVEAYFEKEYDSLRAEHNARLEIRARIGHLNALRKHIGVEIKPETRNERT